MIFKIKYFLRQNRRTETKRTHAVRVRCWNLSLTQTPYSTPLILWFLLSAERDHKINDVPCILFMNSQAQDAKLLAEQLCQNRKHYVL